MKYTNFSNILIPLETSSRELFYKVYLCHQLALKGFRCYLGHKSQINYLIKSIKGYIYLDKGYHKGTSEKTYEVVRQNDGIIISLEEEGGVDFSDGSTILGRYSKTLFANAKLSLLWGEKQYKLVKNNINKDNKVVITGHPRFELLKPEFHYLYQDEVNNIKKRFHDFILINTNMGFGNNIKGDDFVESNYGQRFKTIDQIIAFDKKKLEAYRLLIIKFSEQLDKTIVLRPHPEEDHSFYFDAFKGRKNIHILYEGSVVPWLLAADIVIHPDCTTAIETLFLGKKPLSFLPADYPKDLVTKLPLQASECFTSMSELISFIKNSVNSIGNVDLSNYSFAENYFSISKSTTELIVDYIDHVRIINDKNLVSNLTFTNKLFLMLYELKKQIYSKSQSFQLEHQKLSGFNSKNIQHINNTIIKHNNKHKLVMSKNINSSLFLFQK